MKKTKTEEIEKDEKNSKNRNYRNGKNNKKNAKKKRRWPIVLLVIILIIGIAAGIFYYRVQKLGGGLGGTIAATLGHDENTRKNLDTLTTLVLGESLNLTDTIMLFSYNPRTQEASMLSIPRDTFIGDDPDEATAWDKINSVYQLGVDKLLEDVSNLTGIDVKNYVTVDTAGFKELVDTIGGVTFNVPMDMKYDSYSQGLHIDLKAGEQVLDGDKAEQLVRFRHNNDGTTYPASYGLEDEGRMKTQQAFLTELAKQTLTVGNIPKIMSIIDIANKYVETNMDFNMLKDYVPYLVELNMSDIKKDTLPGEPALTNGVWVYLADEEDAPKVINELFPKSMLYNIEETEDTNTISNSTVNEESNQLEDNTTISGSIEKEDIKIELLNATDNIKNISKMSNLLEDLGYNVTKTGNTNAAKKTVIINRGNVSDSFIDEIKQTLNTAEVEQGGETTVDITIIIGQDYEDLIQD
mgnify:CR=1 FL=1